VHVAYPIPADQSIYQSNGHCLTVCGKYAFAVVQGQSCWCSNYIPSDQQSTSSCNEQCPGYPYENCGSSSSNLYGYVAVGNAASGTAGAAGSSTVSTSTPDPGSQTQTSTSSSTSIDASTGQTARTSTSTQVSCTSLASCIGALLPCLSHSHR
jgi:cell wall integrity and stress response component